MSDYGLPHQNHRPESLPGRTARVTAKYVVATLCSSRRATSLSGRVIEETVAHLADQARLTVCSGIKLLCQISLRTQERT